MTAGQSLVAGTLAGATATMALNLVTYLDMAARGRAPSSVPATVVAKLAERLGIETVDSESARNRRSAIGSLLGFANGLGVGAAYGLLRLGLPRAPVAVATVGLGVAAMALSDVPAARLDATDPLSWSAIDWMADLLPHLAFGATLALAYDACRDLAGDARGS